jgi:hypothetical protein
MTNPFAIITLHAIDSKQLLIYTIGSTVLATFIYKSVIHITSRQNASSCNFLSIFLKPFHYLFNKINDTTPPKEIPFEDKYFNEYDVWIAQQPSTKTQQTTGETNTIIESAEQYHKKECLENLYNSTVRETINDFYGDVIMCYDHATFSFAYYARTANIPYKYLETISRKYMIETNAPREIHVDIRNEYKKAKERMDPAPSTTATATTTATTTATNTTTNTTATDTTYADVFVKLKSYNTVSNLNLHTTTNDTNEKTHKFATTDETKSNNNEAKTASTTAKKIIREKANRYSYRGKINEFNDNDRRTPALALAPTGPAPASDTVEVNDYAEFKKQMMKTRSAL